MKNSFDMMNKIMEKYWLPKLGDRIFRKRYCDKHMREFIKKEKLQKRKDLNIVEIPSICNVCKKPTICYYIEGEI